MPRFRSAALLFVALMAGACRSGPTLPPFGDVDTDADGRIEYREFRAANPEETAKRYLEIDRNKDGRLGPEEWRGAGGRTPPPDRPAPRPDGLQ